MSTKKETDDLGIKVEGDVGELQIVEESSESDDDDHTTETELGKVCALPTVAKGLIHTSSPPVFGSVAVTHSENVQFGNNTYFQGPVTIKQVIQSSPGVDNNAYLKTENYENKTRHFKSKLEDTSFQKYKLKTWVRLTLLAIGVAFASGICALVAVKVTNTQTSRGDGTDIKLDNSSHSMVEGVYHMHVQLILISITLALVTFLTKCFKSLILQGSNGEIVLTTVAMMGRSRSLNINFANNTIGASDLLIAPDHLRIVSRIDWLAQPVEETLDKLRLPAPWVIIMHTATSSCHSQSACVLNVRLLQTFHIESRGWSDIAYNFMVGGDGSAYVGRGWEYVGAHTKGYNFYSISIAFIGTFNTESPTKHQVQACQNLIKLGLAEGKIAKDYKLFAHRQLMSTLSPGDKVLEIISKWPNFVNLTTDEDISSLIPKYKN